MLCVGLGSRVSSDSDSDGDGDGVGVSDGDGDGDGDSDSAGAGENDGDSDSDDQRGSKGYRKKRQSGHHTSGPLVVPALPHVPDPFVDCFEGTRHHTHTNTCQPDLRQAVRAASE